MHQAIIIYCATFFGIECIKNVRRLQRIATRTHPSDVDEKLQQLSWMMILIGMILTFTSSAMFLLCMLGVKIGAGLLVDHLNHKNDVELKPGFIKQQQSQQNRNTPYIEVTPIRSSEIRLIN